MAQNAVFPDVKANDTVNNIGHFAEKIADKYPPNNYLFTEYPPLTTLDGNLYHIARFVERWARA